MAWTTLARLARGGAIERVAHGVYRTRSAPADDRLGVRAAWLQLAPNLTVWERTSEQGVVSRSSAAAIHGLGHLPADIHQFTLPVRRQTRRSDVKLYRADLADDEWIRLGGLLVTRPARTAVDLLGDHEDPQAVGHVIVDALRAGREAPSAVAASIRSWIERPSGRGIQAVAGGTDIVRGDSVSAKQIMQRLICASESRARLGSGDG